MTRTGFRSATPVGGRPCEPGLVAVEQDVHAEHDVGCPGSLASIDASAMRSGATIRRETPNDRATVCGHLSLGRLAGQGIRLFFSCP